MEESRERTVVQPNFLLAPGRSKEILVSIVAYESWPLEPPMRDRYLAVSWKRPFDLHELEHETGLRSAGIGSLTSAPPLLARAWNGSITRGAQTSTSYADWGISSFDVLVEKPSDH